MPTVGSLFAGIGGLDLGLERAGWEVRWQVEIDPFCRRVLEQHWPDVRRYADVREFPECDCGHSERSHYGGAEDCVDCSCTAFVAGVERVDLVCGGFPCQPVSEAGRRLGPADERWLWPDFERVVRALRPPLVLVENTPGLLDRGMGDVLSGLATGGYDAAWDVFPAAAVGAPHIRDRVFIIAASGAMVHAGFDPARCFGGPKEKRWREPIHRVRPRWAGAPWSTEPDVDRVGHGIPQSLDRRRVLGNAVVPQVAEWIGHRLMAAYRLAPRGPAMTPGRREEE